MKRDLEDSDSDDEYIGPSLEKHEGEKFHENDEKKNDAVNSDLKRLQKKRRFDTFENIIPLLDRITHSEDQDSPLTVLENYRGNSLVVGAFKKGTVRFWQKNRVPTRERLFMGSICLLMELVQFRLQRATWLQRYMIP